MRQTISSNFRYKFDLNKKLRFTFYTIAINISRFINKRKNLKVYLKTYVIFKISFTRFKMNKTTGVMIATLLEKKP